MVRTIEVPGNQIQVRDGQIELHANIGSARVVRATLVVEESPANPAVHTKQISVEQWEKQLDELLAHTPPSPFPVDDSREAMYGKITANPRANNDSN